MICAPVLDSRDGLYYCCIDGDDDFDCDVCRGEAQNSADDSESDE